MKNALIIHGAYGNPQENWIPWLKEQLETCGYRVTVPVFQTPENQSFASWQTVMDESAFDFNEESVVIGHSIGATFVLSLLEKHEIHKAVCVAGFVSDLTSEENDYSTLDSINHSFYGRDIDWGAISLNCSNVTLFQSSDDPYVSINHGEELASKLSVDLAMVEDAGHFNEAAGYTEFPQLLESVVPFARKTGLIIPMNTDGEIYIQDRRGYKLPDWGFFGGGMDEGENHNETVLRKAKEELDIEIVADDVEYLGSGVGVRADMGDFVLNHYYLHKADRKEFTVLEGQGGVWVSSEMITERMKDGPSLRNCRRVLGWSE